MTGHVTQQWAEAERIIRAAMAGYGNDSIDVTDALADAGIIAPRPNTWWPQRPHDYLSTGCFHGDHAYCQSMTGQQGDKRPGRCKFCDARCRCSCHRTP